jgi:VanZ family protein
MTNAEATGSSSIFRVFLRTLPAIVWMALIFHYSSQPRPPLPNVNIQPILLDQSDWLSPNNLLAKAIHLMQYAILVCLLYFSLRGVRRAWGLAFLLTSLYAASDEWHQSFVPTRQGSVTDWAIDTLSALGTLILSWGVGRARQLLNN